MSGWGAGLGSALPAGTAVRNVATAGATAASFQVGAVGRDGRAVLCTSVQRHRFERGRWSIHTVPTRRPCATSPPDAGPTSWSSPR